MSKSARPPLLRAAGLRVSSATADLASFVASTSTVARDGHVIVQDGWRLTNYQRNPVVLFAHAWDQLPVGRAEAVRVEDGALRVDVRWTAETENPRGAQVGRLVESGFLNAVSVGFTPLRSQVNEERTRQLREGGGWGESLDILEAELQEISVVPVPADPLALADGRSAPADAALVREWAAAVADAEGALWLPREVASRVRAAMEPPADRDIGADVDALRAELEALKAAVAALAADESDDELTEDEARAYLLARLRALRGAGRH